MRVLSMVHSGGDIKCRPGDELDLPDEIAAKWVKDTWAIPVVVEEKPAVVETAAMAGPPETAVGRRQRRKRG